MPKHRGKQILTCAYNQLWSLYKMKLLVCIFRVSNITSSNLSLRNPNLLDRAETENRQI